MSAYLAWSAALPAPDADAAVMPSDIGTEIPPPPPPRSSSSPRPEPLPLVRSDSEITCFVPLPDELKQAGPTILATALPREVHECPAQPAEPLWVPEDRMLTDTGIPMGGEYMMIPWNLVVSHRGPEVFVMLRIELHSEVCWPRYFGHVTIAKGKRTARYCDPSALTGEDRDAWHDVEAHLRWAFGCGREFSMFKRTRSGPDAGTFYENLCSWFDPEIRRFAQAQLALRRPENPRAENELTASCHAAACRIETLLHLEVYPRAGFHWSVDSAWKPREAPDVPEDQWGRHAPVPYLEQALESMIRSEVVWEW